MKRHFCILLLVICNFLASSQVTCNAAGDVFVFASYDGGHLTIDADLNIPGIKIGIRSYERTRVTVVGTFSANIDTIIMRGYNSGNLHCPPAIATNTVVQAANTTTIIYQNGGGTGPYYTYNCGSITASSPIISWFTNGNAARLRGYISYYECWCNPVKLSYVAANCCTGTYACTTPLPVELSSFKTEVDQDKVVVNWTTMSEFNNKRFEVEKSLDGINFVSIAVINGKGTSNTRNEYSYLDQSITEGLIYYRLKQNDLNGSFVYSDISSVNFNKNELVFYPNPATDFLILKNVAPGSAVIIRNLLGEIVYSEKDTQIISLTEFSNGTYLVESGNYFQKLIIAR